MCNYTSRDWSYCAVNALAEFQNSPWGQNRLARRLNTSPSNRVEFQAEAYNERVSRYHPYGYSTWSWSNSASDGTGSDGSTWTGTHYMKADPNNGAGFASNENYQGYSPVLTYKVAFPQSGIFYVCVRGMGGSPSDDSLHAGIDDNNDGVADASTALDMSGSWHLTSWQWSNRRIGRRLRHGAGQRRSIPHPQNLDARGRHAGRQDRAQHECELSKPKDPSGFSSRTRNRAVDDSGSNRQSGLERRNPNGLRQPDLGYTPEQNT